MSENDPWKNWYQQPTPPDQESADRTVSMPQPSNRPSFEPTPGSGGGGGYGGHGRRGLGGGAAGAMAAPRRAVRAAERGAAERAAAERAAAERAAAAGARSRHWSRRR